MKGIFKKLKGVIEWFKKEYKFCLSFLFLLITLLVFIKFWDDYIELIFFNKNALKIFLPFLLFFIAIYINKKDNKAGKTEMDLFLSASSIVLAILFFLIQFFLSNQDKVSAVLQITQYNCWVAKNNSSYLAENPNGVAIVEFIVGPYKENFSFLYSQMGSKYGSFFQNNLKKMEAVNSLIRLTHNGNSNNPEYNKQIIDISKKIKDDICELPAKLFNKNTVVDGSENKDSATTISTSTDQIKSVQ